MARVRIPITVITATGDAVNGAAVDVRKRSDGTSAIVYQAETGPTTITNPVSTNAQGIAPGWIDRGAYNANITGSGISPYTQAIDMAPASNATVDVAWLDPSVDSRLDALEEVGLVTEFSAITSLDIAVDSSIYNMLKLEFEIVLSACTDLRMLPNNNTGSVYSQIRDGSYLTSAGAQNAVAASGAYSHNNGLILANVPAGAASGGVTIVGSAILQLRAGARGRLCRVQNAVYADTGSGNHEVELQNQAHLYKVNTAITSVRIMPSTGTMTGCIESREIGS